jgi:hypothetical protein
MKLYLYVLPNSGKSCKKFSLNVLPLQVLVQINIWRAVSTFHLMPVNDLKEAPILFYFKAHLNKRAFKRRAFKF